MFPSVSIYPLSILILVLLIPLILPYDRIQVIIRREVDQTKTLFDTSPKSNQNGKSTINTAVRFLFLHLHKNIRSALIVSSCPLIVIHDDATANQNPASTQSTQDRQGERMSCVANRRRNELLSDVSHSLHFEFQPFNPSYSQLTDVLLQLYETYVQYVDLQQY